MPISPTMPQGWQWVAGSGADAAPYFRIFNPITQGQKFDPEGDYVRRWCPELAPLPREHIHAPFNAPADLLTRCGIQPGGDLSVSDRRARGGSPGRVGWL